MIKQTDTELEALKGKVEITTEKAELAQLEKEVNAIQVTVEKKNVFTKSRERVKENPRWKTAAIASGV